MAEIARAELAPRAAAAEEPEEFPRDAFRLLGEAGLLGMPYPEEYGGSGQPYEVYLQALEEVAAAWMTVGVGISVHVMTCFVDPAQRHPGAGRALAAGADPGDLLGAYALSEPRRAPTSPP